MVLIGTDNMRDVVAFPKTQRGQDLLMEAPSRVEPEQLEELGIRLRGPRTD
jgi:aspartyl-tRNA synthetase